MSENIASVVESFRLRAISPSRIVCVMMLASIVLCAGIAFIDIHFSGVGFVATLTGGAYKWGWLAVANTVCIELAAVSMFLIAAREYRGRVSSARVMSRCSVFFIILAALLCVVINGFVWMLGFYVFQLICVVTYQVINDPYLSDSVPWYGLGISQKLRSAVRTMCFWDKSRTCGDVDITEDESAYRKAYMPMNVFNLLWLFVVGSVVGLLLETVWHLVFFGEWQDRAGLVWGPFSPIYGTGAVCLTLALNRFWRSNPIVIFLVSGVCGSTVEYFTSLYLEAAVGVVAWDYTGTVGSIGGRTNLFFFLCWGFLGLLWIKVLLPLTMRVVDAIPLQFRALLTSIMFAFLLVDFSMTIVACDCWSKRHAGLEPNNGAEVFFAEHFGDDWMASRFQTMTFGDTSVHVQIEEDAGLRFV